MVQNFSGMQENEFEKQVKELMDDFYVVPSEPVWIKIKRQLNKKRRRTWPFIFSLLMLGLISGSIIYLNDIKHNKTVTNLQQDQSKQTQIITDNKKAIAENKGNYKISKDSFKDQEIQHANTKILQQQNLAVIKKQNATTINQFSNHQSIKSKNTFLTLKNRKPLNNIYISNDVATTDNISLSAKKTTRNIITKVDDIINTDSIQHKNKNIVDTMAKKSLIITDSLKNKTDESVFADSSHNQKKSLLKKVKPNKWQLGITAYVGRGNLTSSFLNLNSGKTLQMDYLSITPGNSVGDTNGFIRSRPYKLYKASASFGLGFSISKPVAKHIYISSGLNYLYLSATTQAGNRVDSALLIPYSSQLSFRLNSYYTTGTSNYTNRFHFIELPIYFKQDFINSKKISVSYNAGFSVMQLIAAHALIYDANKNIFYSQNNQLNHTQFQLAGGLNFQFNLKNNTAVTVGPHVGYSLSGFVKNTNYSKLHYSNYGLQLNWLFKK